MCSDVDKHLLDYRVRFEIATPAMPTEEPAEYVVSIDGAILYEPDDQESSVVGSISTVAIHGGRAINDHYPIDDVFDATDEVHQLYGALFNVRTRELKAGVQSKYEVYGCDILYLKAIEIIAPHRGLGLGLGLAIVSRAIDMLSLGDSSLVVCKPYPLQYDSAHRDAEEWRERMDVAAFVSNQNSAQAKLRGYWRRLGFSMIRGTSYAALSMNLRRPSLRQALGREE